MNKKMIFAALGGLVAGVLLVNTGTLLKVPFGTIGMPADIKAKLGIA